MNDAAHRRALLAGLYFALAGAGLIGTWSFNLGYAGGNYLGDWFANPASSSVAVDVIVVVCVAAVFFVVESGRLGWRRYVPAAFVAMSIVVAVSFALPLFLGLRELRSGRRRTPAQEPSSGVAPR